MRKISLIIILVITIVSCQSEKDKKIDEKSSAIFEKSVENIKKSYSEINIDSVREIYEKCKSEKPQTGLDYANDLKKYSDKLLFKSQRKIDSITKLCAKRRENQKNEIAESEKKWINSKYGKLQKKHPNWTNDECINIINKKIWIGMSLEMLKYMRGRPDTANPSNYGSGTQWQWCWDDYTPSCFYGGDDGIITSYN